MGDQLVLIGLVTVPLVGVEHRRGRGLAAEGAGVPRGGHHDLISDQMPMHPLVDVAFEPLHLLGFGQVAMRFAQLRIDGRDSDRDQPAAGGGERGDVDLAAAILAGLQHGQIGERTETEPAEEAGSLVGHGVLVR